MFLFHIFAIPVIWVALIVFLAGCGILALVEHTDLGCATFSTLSVLAFLHMDGVINIWRVLHNPLAVLGVVAVYLSIGAIWAVTRWWFYVKSWQRDSIVIIQGFRKKFLRRNGINGDEVPEELIEGWQKSAKEQFATYYAVHEGLGNHLTDNAYDRSDNEAPRVTKHVNDLLVWSVYWPLSMLWTIIDDPLRRFFHYLLVDVLGRYLQAISDRSAQAVNQELTK